MTETLDEQDLRRAALSAASLLAAPTMGGRT
jgi:hypothetical protein